jgi:hypothetical protein
MNRNRHCPKKTAQIDSNPDGVKTVYSANRPYPDYPPDAMGGRHADRA